MKQMASVWDLEQFEVRTEGGEAPQALRQDLVGHLAYTADIARAPAIDLARLILVATGLLLLRSLLVTGRGLGCAGRMVAGLFASSFDAAVSTAGARDPAGRPLGFWPPRT